MKVNIYAFVTWSHLININLKEVLRYLNVNPINIIAAVLYITENNVYLKLNMFVHVNGVDAKGMINMFVYVIHVLERMDNKNVSPLNMIVPVTGTKTIV